jgi:predicted heme/steroid binding protein
VHLLKVYLTKSCSKYIVLYCHVYEVTIDGVWIGDSSYCTLWYTSRDYILQVTVTHTLVFTVTSSLPLLGSGFLRRTFPCLWAPETSPASDISFSHQWLTAAEPHSLTNQLIHWLTSGWRPSHTNLLLFLLPSQDSRPFSNGSWPSLYSLGTDRTENIASNSSSIVACMSVTAIT